MILNTRGIFFKCVMYKNEEEEEHSSWCEYSYEQNLNIITTEVNIAIIWCDRRPSFVEYSIYDFDGQGLENSITVKRKKNKLRNVGYNLINKK